MGKQLKKGFVIIGGGHAGISAIEGFRKIDSKSRLYLIDDDPDNFYFRAATKFLIKGRIEEKDIQGRPDNFFKSNKIKLLKNSALKINSEAKIITLEDDKLLPYEKLCIATGATPFLPPISGINLKNVFVHRSLEDTRKIINLVEKGDNFHPIIIGGGVLGVELAEALALRNIEVELVTLDSRLIPRMIDDYASSILHQHLINNKISIHYSSSVREIIGDEHSFSKGVVLQSNDIISGNAVFICTGIKRNLSLALDAKIEANRGIQVNRFMQTSNPHIFAAGDVVEFKEDLFHHQFIELWGPAGQMGKVAGMNMAGAEEIFNLDVFHAYTLLFKQNCHCIGDYQPNEPALYDIKVSKYEWNGNSCYFKLVFKENVLVGALTFGEARDAMLLDHIIKQNKPLPSNFSKEDLLDRTFDLDRILYAWK